MPVHAGKPAVLIVDDEPSVRETACEMFASLGCRCFDAYNGFDALRILASHPEIVLVFTDVRMPGMSGRDLAEEAVRLRPGLKVVLTSGWIDESPLKPYPFLPKPYRMSDVASVLSGVAGGASPRL
jgi:CheY-like chemotaxis protein